MKDLGSQMMQCCSSQVGKLSWSTLWSRVFLLLVFLSLQEDSTATTGCLFQKSTTTKGSRLVHYVFEKLSVFSVIDCALSCLRHNCCISTNYKELGDKKENCELNYAKGSDHPNELIRDEDYAHYEMIDPVREVDYCCSFPCQNGGKCNTPSGQCSCPSDTTGSTCEQVSGSSKAFPASSCQSIKDLFNSSQSKTYWIKPKGFNDSFQAYCDMETHGGGWTLVYRYTFTNYSNFYHSSNAVTPRPDWPALNATVPESTVAPRNRTSLGALSFNYWKNIGDEFMIISNINDGYICHPVNGSIVEKKDGLICCEKFNTVVNETRNCPNGTMVPDGIQWEDWGPKMKSALGTQVSFDGSTTAAVPRHAPCSRGHKTGVVNPVGEVYLRSRFVPFTGTSC